MLTYSTELQMLPFADWLQRAKAHKEKTSPWLNAFRKRRETRKRHPLYDFLFKYYQYNKYATIRVAYIQWDVFWEEPKQNGFSTISIAARNSPDPEKLITLEDYEKIGESKFPTRHRSSNINGNKSTEHTSDAYVTQLE